MPTSSSRSSAPKIGAPVRTARATASDGPGADHPLVAEDQLGDVDAVAHLGDVDRLEGGAEGCHHLAQQVVRHRPGRPHPLLLERDRGRLDGADPDGQVPLPLRLLEQQDRLVAGQLDPDTDDSKLLHGAAPSAAPGGCGRSDWSGGGGRWGRVGSVRWPDPRQTAGSTVRRSHGRRSSRRRASSSAVWSCADSVASSRSFSVARVRASSERARSTGATSCSTSPASRSTPAAVDPQVPRLDAVPGQAGGGAGDGQVGGRVPAVGVGGEQAELHAVGQLLRLQAGGPGELLGGQRRATVVVVAVGGGGGGTGAGPAAAGSGSPRSSASRCSLMTRSGRYWSRWAART